MAMADSPKRTLPKKQWPWERRKQIWDPPTLLDQLLDSPLLYLVTTIYRILLTFRGPSYQPPTNKPSIRIVCLSDTHTNTVSIPSGDVLIHAGDMTNAGTVDEIQNQLDWLASQPHREKVIIAGNHDYYFDPFSRAPGDRNRKLDFKGMHFLQNKSITLKLKGRKLNVYGAGDSPKYDGAPLSAFQYNRDNHPWKNRIPIETDVLVTHTPPSHHQDIKLGCAGLLQEIWRVKPKVHIFGHIHSGHGKEYVFWDAAQQAQEHFSDSRSGTGIIGDVVSSKAWTDALRVIWYSVRGLLWQWLMVGGAGGNGSIFVNTAIVYQSTLIVGNPAEVVDV